MPLICRFLSLSGHFIATKCETFQCFKDKDYCQIEIIKRLTDKGQFQ